MEGPVTVEEGQTAAPRALRPGVSPGATLLLSVADGVWIGACAGAVYAVLVALFALFASGSGHEGSASGSVGLAAVVGLVAIPVGIVLGAALGLVFGSVALTTASYPVRAEVLGVALFGCAVLVPVLVAGGGGAGVAWAGGPLLVGTPAAALHARRLRRRTSPR